MIILAVIQDKVVDGKKKAAGRKLRRRVALGVYRFGWAIATSTGDKGVFTGQTFPSKLAWAARDIPEFCEGVSPEDFRAMMQKALCTAFDREVEGDLTLEELDAEFGTTERTADSSGELLLYKKMREKWVKDRDIEKGDVILWSCTGEENGENE